MAHRKPNVERQFQLLLESSLINSICTLHSQGKTVREISDSLVVPRLRAQPESPPAASSYIRKVIRIHFGSWKVEREAQDASTPDPKIE